MPARRKARNTCCSSVCEGKNTAPAKPQFAPVASDVPDKNGNLQGLRPLPNGWQNYRFVDITQQSVSGKKVKHGRSVLRGPLVVPQPSGSTGRHQEVVPAAAADVLGLLDLGGQQRRAAAGALREDAGRNAAFLGPRGVVVSLSLVPGHGPGRIARTRFSSRCALSLPSPPFTIAVNPSANRRFTLTSSEWTLTSPRGRLL